MRYNFSWSFVIADVSRPIIETDFLELYGLLVDLKGAQLIDGGTKLVSAGDFSLSVFPA